MSSKSECARGCKVRCREIGEKVARCELSRDAWTVAQQALVSEEAAATKASTCLPRRCAEFPFHNSPVVEMVSARSNPRAELVRGDEGGSTHDEDE